MHFKLNFFHPGTWFQGSSFTYRYCLPWAQWVLIALKHIYMANRNLYIYSVKWEYLHEREHVITILSLQLWCALVLTDQSLFLALQSTWAISKLYSFDPWLRLEFKVGCFIPFPKNKIWYHSLVFYPK